MRFSVITITKNNPQGFTRTRQSVQDQGFKDFEWVVIDGNAQADNGIYDAMNKGLDRSSGEYAIFMNAGDMFASPDTLERMAQRAGADFLYGDAIEDGHLKPARHNIAQGMITHHQAMAYRRSELRYDTRYKIAADYKFTAQALSHGTRAYLPFPICIFERGGISQTNTALGRHEQKLIRNELGLKAPFAAPLQVFASGIKKIAPKLYWAARSRLKTSRA